RLLADGVGGVAAVGDRHGVGVDRDRVGDRQVGFAVDQGGLGRDGGAVHGQGDGAGRDPGALVGGDGHVGVDGLAEDDGGVEIVDGDPHGRADGERPRRRGGGGVKVGVTVEGGRDLELAEVAGGGDGEGGPVGAGGPRDGRRSDLGAVDREADGPRYGHRTRT